MVSFVVFLFIFFKVLLNMYIKTINNIRLKPCFASFLCPITNKMETISDIENEQRESELNKVSKSDSIRINTIQDTIDESNKLYLLLLVEQLHHHKLSTIPLENEQYLTPPKNAECMIYMARKFCQTPLRTWVFEQSLNIDINCLNFKTFQQLVQGLFEESRESPEKVLIVLYFCSDLTVRAAQETLIEWFYKIYNWTTFFLNNQLSAWVKQQGGWEVVLRRSNRVKTISILGLCAISILGLIIYLRCKK